MKREPRSPLLSARVNWIFVEIVVIFTVIVIYTLIVWMDEIGKVGQTSLETFKAVVSVVAQFSHLAIIFAVCIFEIGGEIMIRFTYKIQKAIEQGDQQGYERGIAQGKVEGKVEGIEQGKDEIYRAWYADWERRKQAAAEKGIPFDDPPPPNPNNHINQG